MSPEMVAVLAAQEAERAPERAIDALADCAVDVLRRLAEDHEASDPAGLAVALAAHERARLMEYYRRCLLTSRVAAHVALERLAAALPIGYARGRAEGQAICLETRSGAIDGDLALLRASIGPGIRDWASEWARYMVQP